MVTIILFRIDQCNAILLNHCSVDSVYSSSCVSMNTITVCSSLSFLLQPFPPLPSFYTDPHYQSWYLYSHCATWQWDHSQIWRHLRHSITMATALRAGTKASPSMRTDCPSNICWRRVCCESGHVPSHTLRGRREGGQWMHVLFHPRRVPHPHNWHTHGKIPTTRHTANWSVSCTLVTIMICCVLDALLVSR